MSLFGGFFWCFRARSSREAKAISEAVVMPLLIALPLMLLSWVLAHPKIPTAMMTAAMSNSTRVKPDWVVLFGIAQPDLRLKFLVMVAVFNFGVGKFFAQLPR